MTGEIKWWIYFDLAESIFHSQPGRVYKMKSQEERTGFPGKGRHIQWSVEVWIPNPHITFKYIH